VPRIAEETIQRVAEANDIVEVIGSYFPLKRAGTSWRALCPFHREKSPSFHVNPQRQAYHCFGCGAGGSVFRFVMDYEHLDFVSAVRRLAQRAGIPVIEEAGSPDDDRRHEVRKRLLALHVEASAWFHHNLLKTPDAQRARDYLKSRGITVEVAKSWQLGFAPDSWDALLDFLRGKNFSPEEIAQSGLSASKDDDERGKSYARFRDRLMFPIRNDYGEVIAFSGRVLDFNGDAGPPSPHKAKAAKYVNSPETPLFTKGRVLYGLDKSKRALINAKTAIVCEGQLDLISAYEAGVQNVIAPQGTAFTADQARVLQRFVETVVLCFDSDRAGQEAVTRSLPALLEHGLEVRVARLPAGEDPDSLIRNQGVAEFRNIVDSAKNFFNYALERLGEKSNLSEPSGKASAARRLGPYVSAIKDPVLREATARNICTRLGITEAAFATHTKPTILSNRGNELSEVEKIATEPLPIESGVRTLCVFAIVDAQSRQWMRKQTESFAESELSGWTLLKKILHSDLPLESPASLAVFTTGLTPPEEKTISLLNLRIIPENPLQSTQDTWNGFIAQNIEHQTSTIKFVNLDSKLNVQEIINLQIKVLKEKNEKASAQLQTQGHLLNTLARARLEEQVEILSKQILDLQSRLNEV